MLVDSRAGIERQRVDLVDSRFEREALPKARRLSISPLRSMFLLRQYHDVTLRDSIVEHTA